MPRVISSAWTPVYKFIMPTLWIGAFGIAMFAIGLRSNAPAQFRVVFPAVWVIGSTVWLKLCGPLKKIVLDGSSLVVSNYSREIRIPISQIAELRERRWSNPRLITIMLSHDMGFGTRIVFTPHRRFLWPWQEHPVMKELRELSRVKPDKPPRGFADWV